MDDITSNMDYIYSPTIPTKNKMALASVSDHFCLLRLYDVNRIYRTEIRVGRETINRNLRKSKKNYGADEIRPKFLKKLLTTNNLPA